MVIWFLQYKIWRKKVKNKYFCKIKGYRKFATTCCKFWGGDDFRIVIVIEVIHFSNPICTVKFSSPVVQSATARGTRWNASPLPKRTAIIPNMVNCRFPLPLRIIYRFYCGRFCIKCFPCLCVPLSDIKAVQGDSGHAQVNMITDAYSQIPDDDQRKNAELFKEAFYEKKNLNPERRALINSLAKTMK